MCGFSGPDGDAKAGPVTKMTVPRDGQNGGACWVYSVSRSSGLEFACGEDGRGALALALGVLHGLG